ncbi:hypothetical protein H6F42_19045 [Pseudanabaena sp. FACHB-1998]|uniref:hypothetical protein n=1 Tax=Pseudanabaena sp. FACHB-1998 TaxID=2692858 RepID=UPI001680447E|nr:hypothetical protein [Pseudanabaena sp. FACHB-1998]MBD2179023.1 hypothetical protein [Pseudanabaena sp. FACHB-1998]
MTPTLIGRWQTRLLLLGTLGVIVTIPFSLSGDSLYFQILLSVAFLGCIWDIGYNFLQTLRWDRDWSALLQLAAGIWEAIFIYFPFKFLIRDLLKLNWLSSEIPLDKFLWHYCCVWLAVFIASQTIMRVIFPRWRFLGGQWF